MFKYFKYSFILFITALFLGNCSQPKPEEPNSTRRKSPIAIAKTLHQPSNTYIKIVYGQPYKHGRSIFGKLVPYDSVWRTGANEATELTATKDVMVGGERLEAGTYTLFTIPKENEPWTIILNNKLGQWGAFDYKPQFDELRFDAGATNINTATEAFTIQFSDISGNSTNITMRWDQTEITVPIKFIAKRAADSTKKSS